MPHARSRFGAVGEGLAAAYLAERGYRVIDRNVRTLFGELDLICTYKREVVFVEVKTRSSERYGLPEEAITKTKQAHLVRASRAYIASHAELRGRPFRIDVVAIVASPGRKPEIRHIPNAVGDNY